MLRMPNEDPSLSKDFRPLGSPLPRAPKTPSAQTPQLQKTGTPGVWKNTETGKLETMIPTPSKLAPAPTPVPVQDTKQKLFEDETPYFKVVEAEKRRAEEFRKFQEYLRKDMEQAMLQARTKTRYVVDPAKLTAAEKIDWQDWFSGADIVDKNLFNEQFLQRPDQVLLTKEARMNAIQKLTPSKDAPLFDMIKKNRSHL